MSNCDCPRNQKGCPVCEIYGMIYMRDFRTWDCPTRGELNEIISNAEKKYHKEIVDRYDGGIGET